MGFLSLETEDTSGNVSGAAEEAGLSGGSSELVSGLPFMCYLVASIQMVVDKDACALYYFPDVSLVSGDVSSVEKTLNPETVWSGRGNVGMMECTEYLINLE